MRNPFRGSDGMIPRLLLVPGITLPAFIMLPTSLKLLAPLFGVIAWIIPFLAWSEDKD